MWAFWVSRTERIDKMTAQKRIPRHNTISKLRDKSAIRAIGNPRVIPPAWPKTVREALAANARSAGFDLSGCGLESYLSMEPTVIRERADAYEILKLRLLVKLEEALAYYPLKK